MTTMRRAAFTITELLVVIGIIVLLIALAVPAFSTMLASSERAMAENQLKAGLFAARDAAMQSEAGDGAAVFFFTPGGRVVIVPCIAVAEIEDALTTSNSNNQTMVRREIFVPVPVAEPLQLPRGWSVRAYAAPQYMYSLEQPELWYESYFSGGIGPRVAVRGGWVFPETGFYDTQAAAVNSNTAPSGTRRQSFMVRFKAGSGDLDISNASTALVFDPVPSGAFRTSAPYANYRADQLRIGTSVAPNAATFVRRLANLPEGSLSRPALRALLGDRSPDTVLVRPVTELALYEEARLAAGIGARRLNRATGTLYGDPAAPNAVPAMPRMDETQLSADTRSQAQLAEAIQRWIEGRNGSGPPAVQEPFDARIYSLQRYLGQITEVKP